MKVCSLLSLFYFEEWQLIIEESLHFDISDLLFNSAEIAFIFDHKTLEIILPRAE